LKSTETERGGAGFDAYAASYEAELARGLALSGEGQAFYAEQRMRHLAAVLARTPRRALDFGCGAGTTTPLFLEVLGAAALDGVEPSPSLRERATREHGSERARFHAPESLEAGAHFDLAFCNGVFHHILPAERPAAARYVFERLAPGGRFALWENNPWNPGTRWIMSRVSFDRDAIPLAPPETRRLLAAAGFRLLRTDFLFFFPGFLRWLRPLERHLRSVPLGGQYLVLGEKP
jgi:SAM-dependent methyltransferase